MKLPIKLASIPTLKPEGTSRVNGAGELHPRALSEPYLNLSTNIQMKVFLISSRYSIIAVKTLALRDARQTKTLTVKINFKCA